MTPRQLEALEFIEGYWDKNQYAPSYADIAKGLGVSSTNTVYTILHRLERAGWIQKNQREHRSVRSTRRPAGAGAVLDAETESSVPPRNSAP